MFHFSLPLTSISLALCNESICWEKIKTVCRDMVFKVSLDKFDY